MGLLPFTTVIRGRDCIVAAAIHNGHDTRPEVEQAFALSEDSRLREEDPYTGALAQAAKIQIVGLRSRFEVDLNRPREEAVYQTPQDAWGLETWKAPLDPQVRDRSLREYDLFYAQVQELLSQLLEKHDHLVMLDLHSYNHRRDGVDAEAAPQTTHPEINIGTGTMDRDFWAPVVEQFIGDLSSFEHRGRSLDVRENVKFKGGYFGRWIHDTFPRRVCTLAIEVKKFFMDEWSGACDLDELERVFLSLQSTLPGIRKTLQGMPS